MSRTIDLHAMKAPHVPFSFWYISFAILVMATESLLRKQELKIQWYYWSKQDPQSCCICGTHFSTFPWRIRQNNKLRKKEKKNERFLWRRKRKTLNPSFSTFTSKPFQRRPPVLQYCVHVEQHNQEGIIMKYFRECRRIFWRDVYHAFAVMFP